MWGKEAALFLSKECGLGSPTCPRQVVTGIFREHLDSPKRGKMLLENSFKSLKLPARLIWLLWFTMESCRPSPAVRVLHHSELQCQGGFEKCQWALFPQSHTCPGAESLWKTKTLRGTGHKMKRIERRERGRREGKKIGMWTEGDKGVTGHCVIKN